MLTHPIDKGQPRLHASQSLEAVEWGDFREIADAGHPKRLSGHEAARKAFGGRGRALLGTVGAVVRTATCIAAERKLLIAA